MWFGLIGFYIVLGILDYAFQVHNMLNGKEEVKQEYKEAEGDPYMKPRRYEIQHEIQSGSLAHDVKRSAVVIRNPTHISICLGYHPQEMPVLRVLDKGMAGRTGQIVGMAQRTAMPVVENIPLSRALFSMLLAATEYRKRCLNRLRYSCAWCWKLTMNAMKNGNS